MTNAEKTETEKTETEKTETEKTQQNQYSLEKVNDIFKIPICYNDKVKKLNTHIVCDLELIKTKEEEETSIYTNVLKPANRVSSKVVEQMAQYYTVDEEYLKDTQNYIKSVNDQDLNTIYNKYELYNYDLYMNNIVSTWEEITGDNGFREKYLYIDWSFAKELNNNPSFLQIMSVYNIASPILSLCLPILVLIVPFFIIKMKGIELNIKEYVDILKVIIANHAIFKVFTQFHTVDNGQKIYLLVSAAFYLFSIYQNILVCIRFYSNMRKIHTYLASFKKYLSYTIDMMKYHYSLTFQLTKYTDFNTALSSKIDVLEQIYTKINKITPFYISLAKFSEIGHIMYTFYQLYDHDEYKEAFLYSFGFHGYFKMICNLSSNVKENKINQASFIDKHNKNTNKKKKNKKPVFKKMYYPKFINEQEDTIVKNDCSLNKNMIITGPNASGKTTTLKSALLNLLLSQQFGYGCFESLKFSPYDHFHCYLNIPDTSGRDSLFQAEARRCKDIIDYIDVEEGATHFGIFDELYSGTNPSEAVTSAAAFMDYIVKHTNVTCLLTTHYVALCKKLVKNKRIKNYSMSVEKNGDNIQYTYLIQEGISKIKGGLKVLHDMKYPKEILNNI